MAAGLDNHGSWPYLSPRPALKSSSEHRRLGLQLYEAPGHIAPGATSDRSRKVYVQPRGVTASLARVHRRIGRPRRILVSIQEDGFWPGTPDCGAARDTSRLTGQGHGKAHRYIGPSQRRLKAPMSSVPTHTAVAQLSTALGNARHRKSRAKRHPSVYGF